MFFFEIDKFWHNDSYLCFFFLQKMKVLKVSKMGAKILGVPKMGVKILGV